MDLMLNEIKLTSVGGEGEISRTQDHCGLSSYKRGRGEKGKISFNEITHPWDAL